MPPGPLAAKRVLLAKCLREAVLNRIMATRLVTNDGRRNTQEVSVTPPVERLNLAGQRPSLCHHQTMHERLAFV